MCLSFPICAAGWSWDGSLRAGTMSTLGPYLDDSALGPGPHVAMPILTSLSLQGGAALL